jgi:hypothetical protein
MASATSSAPAAALLSGVSAVLDAMSVAGGGG